MGRCSGPSGLASDSSSSSWPLSWLLLLPGFVAGAILSPLSIITRPTTHPTHMVTLSDTRNPPPPPPIHGIQPSSFTFDGRCDESPRTVAHYGIAKLNELYVAK